MKNRYRILPLIIFMSAMHSLNAQDWTIGVIGDIGFSKVTNISDALIGLDLDPSTGAVVPKIDILDYEEKNFALSGNLGFFVEKNIGEKSSIVLQCLLMQVNGKGLNTPSSSVPNQIQIGNNGGLGNYGVIKQPYLETADSTNVYGTAIDQKISLNYLVLPLIYRYKVGKFGISGGVVTMLGLSAKLTNRWKNGATDETSEVTSPLRDFRKVDLGTSIGFDYEISKNIRLSVSYYQGLRDIRESEIYKQASKSRQVSLGVDYVLWRK